MFSSAVLSGLIPVARLIYMRDGCSLSRSSPVGKAAVQRGRREGRFGISSLFDIVWRGSSGQALDGTKECACRQLLADARDWPHCSPKPMYASVNAHVRRLCSHLDGVQLPFLLRLIQIVRGRTCRHVCQPISSAWSHFRVLFRYPLYCLKVGSKGRHGSLRLSVRMYTNMSVHRLER